MKRLLPFVLLSACLMSFGPAAMVKEKTFSVLLDGRPIGSYSVKRTDVGNASTLQIETVAAAGLIRPLQHRSVMTSSFDGAELISSHTRTWINGQLESELFIQWDGQQYVIQQGEQLTEICREPVQFSSAQLFFEEPVGKCSLFYEKYGMDLEIVQEAEHQYLIRLPNGSSERYLYENGEVAQVEFVQSFTTISLKKI